MRDVMTFPHRNIAIDLDVKIDIKTQAHFADKALIDLDNAGNGRRRFTDTVDNCTARGGIENLVERGPQQSQPDRCDDETDENRGPVIGAPPFLAADKRD